MAPPIRRIKADLPSREELASIDARIRQQKEDEKLANTSPQNLKHRARVKRADEKTRRTAPSGQNVMEHIVTPISNLYMPSQWVGATIDAIKGKRGFWESLGKGNSGFVSDKFAEEHPYWSMGINMLGDAGAYGSKALIGKVKPKVQRELAFRSMKPKDPLQSNKQYRTDFNYGKGSGKVVHADKGNGMGAFTGNGAFVQDGFLYPGQTRLEGQRNFTWWNRDNMFVPGFTVKRPFSRIMVANESDVTGIQRVKDMKERVGQWNPASKKRSRVFDDEMVTSEPTNMQRVITYNLDPYEESLGNTLYVRQDIPTVSQYSQETLPDGTTRTLWAGNNTAGQNVNRATRNNLVLDNPDTQLVYNGPKRSTYEFVDANGKVDIRKAIQFQRDIAKYYSGLPMEVRLENPKWHKTDPNTLRHTKQVVDYAATMPVPEGFTKRDLIVAALGHDFGKMFIGDGHANVGANLLKNIFHDLTPEQYTAISEHMGNNVSSRLGLALKRADINNGSMSPQEAQLLRQTLIRPSKLSQAERSGIPRGERNQPSNSGVHYGYPSDNIPGENAAFMEDYLNRLRAQGHNTDDLKLPEVRLIDPKNDLYDKLSVNRNAGAWYHPSVNQVTLRSNNPDYGLWNHEYLGHGLRYSLSNSSNPKWPVSRGVLNRGVELEQQTGMNVHIPVNAAQFNQNEINVLSDAYPWVKDFPSLNNNTQKILNERGAVNTQFRAKISQNNNHATGKQLDRVIDNTDDGTILRMLQEQPYTSSISEDIARITNMDIDDIVWLTPKELNQLANKYPKLKEIVSKVKNSMKTVAITTGAISTIGLSANSKYEQGGKIRRFQNSGKIEYEPDWSDKVEPYASAIGLVGDAVGLGTAATGVGVPIGATIAGLANIPNLIIDGYQTVRDWGRVKNDNAPIKDALWNTGELALGLFGAKYAMKGAKHVNDRKVINEIRYRYERELERRNKRKWTFLKSKMTDAQLAEYISQKAFNAAVNSKHVYDAQKEANKKADKLGRIVTHSMSMPVNAYHAKDLIVEPQDNTRYVPKRIITNKNGGKVEDQTKGRFTFKKTKMVKDAEEINGKRDMRKKLVKSDVVTNKRKRIQKGQQGMKFVSYEPVQTPIYKPEEMSPFSEYNYPSTYQQYIVQPETPEEQPSFELFTEPIVKEEVLKPKKPAPKKAPYKGKNQWSKDMADAYRRAGITNENAIRMLIAQDAQESGWGKSVYGNFNYGNLTTGSSWKGKSVRGKDSDGKGNTIYNNFRSYDSIDEYAKDKIDFLTRLYDFNQDDDIHTFANKLQGGNRKKRRYAGDPNYVKSLTRIYNGL